MATTVVVGPVGVPTPAGANDLLVGGPGRDTVNGRGGADTCRAEVTRLCERT